MGRDCQKITGGFGVLVPGSVFNFGRRDVTAGGSGGALIGLKTQQMSGILGWSAVVRSGAQLLGPLADSNVRLFHDSNLPSATWSAESAAVVPADVNFASSTLRTKRVTASIVLSRQLLKQTGRFPSLGQTGAGMTLDEYLISKMQLAFASVLDQAALYGTGAANYQPLGVISTPGTNSVTTASPPTWADLANMRFLATNADVDRSSFGWVSNPQGGDILNQRKDLLTGRLACGIACNAKPRFRGRFLIVEFSRVSGLI